MQFFHCSRNESSLLCLTLLLLQVNCDDDLGILQGKWSGTFDGGVKPTEWSGSADILHQWVSSNCRPVRYGQCWVFASVLCTGTQHECFVVLLVSEYVFEEVLFCFVFSVMRVLGIPSRVVTVFNAGHDGNANTQIEEVYSTTGEKLNLSKDSIWSGSPPHPLLLTSFYFSLIEIWNVCIWPVYLFLFFLYIVNDVVRIR